MKSILRMIHHLQPQRRRSSLNIKCAFDLYFPYFFRINLSHISSTKSSVVSPCRKPIAYSKKADTHLHFLTYDSTWEYTTLLIWRVPPFRRFLISPPESWAHDEVMWWDFGFVRRLSTCPPIPLYRFDKSLQECYFSLIIFYSVHIYNINSTTKVGWNGLENKHVTLCPLSKMFNVLKYMRNSGCHGNGKESL